MSLQKNSKNCLKNLFLLSLAILLILISTYIYTYHINNEHTKITFSSVVDDQKNVITFINNLEQGDFIWDISFSFYNDGKKLKHIEAKCVEQVGLDCLEYMQKELRKESILLENGKIIFSNHSIDDKVVSISIGLSNSHNPSKYIRHDLSYNFCLINDRKIEEREADFILLCDSKYPK